MHIESAPEQLGLDTEDFDEGLIESQNFLIDLGIIQCCEVGVGPPVAYFGNMSFMGWALKLFYKVRTRILMAMLESITQGIHVCVGVDAAPVVSVHDWKTTVMSVHFFTDGEMERTESSLAANTVELIDDIGVPIVWTIVEGVTVM